MRNVLTLGAVVLLTLAAGPASKPTPIQVSSTTRPAAAVAQPASMPAGEYPALRKRLAEIAAEADVLRAKIAELEKVVGMKDSEIAKLHQDVRDAAMPKRTIGKLPESIDEMQTALKDVKKGQTIAEVEWILGKQHETMRKFGGTIYYWAKNEFISVPGMNVSPGNHYVIEALFNDDGTLSTISERFN